LYVSFTPTSLPSIAKQAIGLDWITSKADRLSVPPIIAKNMSFPGWEEKNGK